VQVCNPSIWEAEVGRLRVQGLSEGYIIRSFFYIHTYIHTYINAGMLTLSLSASYIFGSI
jgi:hypothetical protein